MAEVSIRELRNHGGEVVDRVAHGEHVTVTRRGKQVAELRPVRSSAVLIAELEVLPVEAFITAVTLAELSAGPLLATTDEDRVTRQAHLQAAEADFDPLPFDAAAARAFGGAAASLRRNGRKSKTRAYDAMIAATAIAANLPVYTCNPSDFIGIDRLDVVEVPHPDHR